MRRKLRLIKRNKPVVGIDISTSGKGGGPYTSTMNLVNSTLKDKVDFKLIKYKTELGRNISIKRIKDLVCQLKEMHPDIVHFTGLQLSGFHIAVACKLARVPKTIIVIRGSSTEALNITWMKKQLIKWLEIITLYIVDSYYGVSEYASNIPVTSMFRKKNKGHIYNLLPILEEDRVIAAREEFGFSKEDTIIISVARIVKDKGYHILKDAIKKLGDLENIKFLIIGEGDYLYSMQQELVKEIALGKIQFLGYRSDINRILPMGNIFVLPTLHETLSNSLLEASASGLALIGSNVGGVPEIIKSGVNGLLVPPSNATELSNAIRELALDKAKCELMGSEAKRMIGYNFSEYEITKQIFNVYQDLLKR